MRLIKAIISLLAVFFGFVAVVFIAIFSVVTILFRQMLGGRPTTTEAHPNPPGSASRATRADREDVIDVVTTPVKE